MQVRFPQDKEKKNACIPRCSATNYNLCLQSFPAPSYPHAMMMSMTTLLLMMLMTAVNVSGTCWSSALFILFVKWGDLRDVTCSPCCLPALRLFVRL